MTCAKCRNSYKQNGHEPLCWEDGCPTGYDLLDGEDLRLLDIRGMLGLLGEYGLSGRVCEAMEITDEDLAALAQMEITCREIEMERQKKRERSG